MSVLTAARQYLGMGVMPIPIPRGSKVPAVEGWPDLRVTPETIPDHFQDDGNIGVLLGEPSGWLVDVDLDCDEAVRLADRYLPPTDAISGRPSRPRSHRWYRSKGCVTSRLKDRVDKSMIVELRSTGLYTAVGPSLHPDGEFYEVLDGEPARVAPALLLASVRRLAEAVMAERGHLHQKPADGTRRGVVAPPLPEGSDTLRRAAAYLDAMEGAVSGQNGHSTTFTAATAMVHGFGLDDGTALALLRERHNPKCQPPWTERELVHKVEQARTTPHEKPYGWLRDSGATAPDPVVVPEPSMWTVTADTVGRSMLDQACRTDIPVARTGIKPLDDEIGGVVLPGITSIIGAPGHGKSTLAFQAAAHACIKCGLGVRIVSLEMPPERILATLLCNYVGGRWHDFLSGRGVPSEDERASAADFFGRLSESNFGFAGGYPSLDRVASLCRAWADEDVSVVVVDYIQMLSAGESCGGVDAIIRATQWARSASADFGMAVVLLTQPTTQAGREMRQMRATDGVGGQSIYAASDLMLGVYRPYVADPHKATEGAASKWELEEARRTSVISVLKNKYGGLCDIPTMFSPSRLRFEAAPSPRTPDWPRS